MSKKYLIGIDLHGTLLNEQWQIENNLISPLAEKLSALKKDCLIYVCSGNDLTFIQQYIPESIRQLFDGYILETGCTISEGIEEKIIVPSETLKIIKSLEDKLRQANIPEVKYFGRRLSTISLFTRDESSGPEPDIIHDRVKNLVNELGFTDHVLVTHSNVAVDIIPLGFNKFTGMRHIANNLKTIGIADSLNDSHMILGADYSFIPANASAKLLNLLEKNQKTVEKIHQAQKATILQSQYGHTLGVIDALDFIAKNLI